MKNIIRKENIRKRNLLDISSVKNFSMRICNTFTDMEIYKKSNAIMLYSPIGNEVDVYYIKDIAFDDGKRVILPVTDENDNIIPIEVFKNSQYIVGRYNIKEPSDKIIIDKADIDAVIVPGVAFSHKGVRCGFGKGCYDKFLKDMDVPKIGVCYDFQISNELKAHEHDVNMDHIITEKELICCE